MAHAICRASGCRDVVTRGQFTRYCAKHHRALYRHGHTHGNALSKRELSFYRKLVRTKRKATKDAQFWVECETRWLATIRKAQSVISSHNAGRPTHRSTRVAAEAIIKVAHATDSVEVMEVLGAMYLKQEQDPHRFVSDRHFWFCMVRRFRSLGDTLTATRWDGRANGGTGKLRRLYHDLTPRGVDELAKWLVEALGALGAISPWPSRLMRRLYWLRDRLTSRVSPASDNRHKRQKDTAPMADFDNPTQPSPD
jgi:hypothetical protein